VDPKKYISGKRVLIVDDEEDVLDSLSTLLDMCKVDTALTFQEGKRLLEESVYDIAILDIMGVQGFELLEIAIRRNVPPASTTRDSAERTGEKRKRISGRNGSRP
jgi:DNA-binding response OmpR family regulator